LLSQYFFSVKLIFILIIVQIYTTTTTIALIVGLTCEGFREI